MLIKQLKQCAGRSWCCGLVLVICLSHLSASEGVLGDRVVADAEARISFRVPFAYRIPDMHYPGLTRGAVRRGASVTAEEAKGLSPEEVRDLLRKRLQNHDTSSIKFDVELLSVAASELPEDASGQELSALAAQQFALPPLQWQEYDYYARVEERPQAKQSWAPEGVEAALGLSDELTVLALRYGQGLAVVRLIDGIDEHNNRRIIDSVEVMVENRREIMTYRHGAALKGQVIAANGQLIRSPRGNNVAFDQAWSIETGNYHITSNVSAQHLQQYASMMEVLFDAFIKTYEPDKMPVFKLDVSVWSSQREMVQAAMSIGIGGLPPTVGGFFSPSSLNIMTYETGRDDRGASTFNILAHEASHQFLHAACNGSAHVPTWINEGLAVYFESTAYRHGRLQIQVPTQRLDILRRYYGQTGRMLFNIDGYLDHYGHIPGANYGEVYLKTHFWLFGVRGGSERFQKYWRALRAGENGTEAFERIFMEDLISRYGSRQAALNEIEKMIIQYLRSVR